MVTVSMIQHTYIKHTIDDDHTNADRCQHSEDRVQHVRTMFVIVRTCQSAIMITDSMNDMLLLGVVDI
jgi:hypothetical protein